MRVFLVMFIMVLAGCTDTPQGITPVQSFDLTRYLGAWYEIYRLDHAYERDMQAVTATYGVNENGSIKVLNSVYDEVKEEYRASGGRALFVGAEDEGHLKVSFFPFVYGAYVILELGENYDYAMVTSYNHDFF